VAEASSGPVARAVAAPCNLTARAARWSAHHKLIAIGGWIALVIVATMLGGRIGTKTLQNNQQGVGESGHADKIVDDAFPNAVDETILGTVHKYRWDFGDGAAETTTSPTTTHI